MDSLRSFLNQGGESVINGVEIRFVNSEELVSGLVTGLNFDRLNVFEPDVFEPQILEARSLWTAAITTPISREENLETEYYLEGMATQINGEYVIWVVDIGIVSSLTGRYIYFQENLPVNFDGSFSSSLEIPGQKIVVDLKYVTSTEVSYVHRFIVEALENKVIRTDKGSLLDYNSEDQQLSLEKLSISLLNLLDYKEASNFLTYFPASSSERVFYPESEGNIYITSLVTSQLDRLVSLVNLQSETKKGSLPEYLTTYSSSDLLYNDSLYVNSGVSVLEEEVFEVGVFESGSILPLLPYRDISNRSAAWFLYLLCNYKICYASDRYDFFIEQIAEYLLREVGSNYLVRSGWGHEQVYEEMSPTSNYLFSTSAISCISFLKVYEVTGNSKWLEVSASIYKSIIASLCTFSSLSFSTQLNNGVTSLESLTYAYLLFNYLEDNHWLTPLDQKIESLAVYPYDNSQRVIQLSGSRRHNLLIIHLNSSKEFKFLVASEGYKNDALSTPQDLIESIYLVKENLSSTYSLPTKEFKSYNFLWDFLFQKLVSYIPSEYSWFSKEALKLSGQLGKVVYSISSVLASLSTKIAHLAGVSLETVRGIELDNYVALAGIRRYLQETDDELRLRYRKYLQRETIYEFFESINQKVKVKELWRSILSINTFERVENKGSYLEGLTYYPNSIELKLVGPLSKEITEVVSLSVPTGVKVSITSEVISYQEALAIGSLECGFNGYELANDPTPLDVSLGVESVASSTLTVTPLQNYVASLQVQSVSSVGFSSESLEYYDAELGAQSVVEDPFNTQVGFVQLSSLGSQSAASSSATPELIEAAPSASRHWISEQGITLDANWVVSQWLDTVSSAPLTSVSGSLNVPAYVDGGVAFDGTNDLMRSVPASLQVGTIIVAYRQRANSAGGALISAKVTGGKGAAASSENIQLGNVTSSSDSIYAIGPVNSLNINNNSSLSTTSFSNSGVGIDPGNLNDIQVVGFTRPNTNTGSKTFVIGADAEGALGTGHINAIIYEILIYPNQLSQTQLNNKVAELVTKYGPTRDGDMAQFVGAHRAVNSTLTTSELTATSQAITSFKSQNLWNTLDEIYLHIGSNKAGRMLRLKPVVTHAESMARDNTNNPVPDSALTSQGIEFSSTESRFILSSYIPREFGTQNNYSLGVYVNRGSGVEDYGTYAIIGSISPFGTGSNGVLIGYSPSNAQSNGNHGGFTNVSYSRQGLTPNQVGFFSFSGTQNSLRTPYINGNRGTTGLVGSWFNPAFSLAFTGRGNTRIAGGFSSRSVLTDQQHVSVYQIFHTFNTALSRQFAGTPDPLLVPITEVYTASQSSAFGGLVATYTNMTDSNLNTGAATNNGGSEWIQATFSSPQTVAAIEVGGGNLSGWGGVAQYLNASPIQYSTDGGSTWIAVLVIAGVVDSASDIFRFTAPIVAQRWRISRGGWLATSTFRFYTT